MGWPEAFVAAVAIITFGWVAGQAFRYINS